MKIRGMILALLAAGCAQGTNDDVELGSGVYELTTLEVEGDCVLDDAITPGSEYVGKVARVMTDSAAGRVKLEPCNDFFDDECFTEGLSEPISMVRDAQVLYGENRQWEVPGCLCFEDWRGSRAVSGTIVEEGRAELTWTIELPAPPAGCSCDASACSATVEQVLAQP